MRTSALTRQRYFFTAEIAENAENGELLWPLLSRSPVVVVPFPCFLPFSAFSAPSAVKSRVVGLSAVHMCSFQTASSQAPVTTWYGSSVLVQASYADVRICNRPVNLTGRSAAEASREHRFTCERAV